MLRTSLVVLLLAAPSAAEGPLLEQLRGQAPAAAPEVPRVGAVRRILEASKDLPPVPWTHFGPATFLRVAVPCPGCGRTPVTSLPLDELLNVHWKTSTGFGSGNDRVHLSAQFDRDGEMHLAAMGDDWPAPFFYMVERGMSGRWGYRNAGYNVSLNVNIFRARLNNIIEVRRDGQTAVHYKTRIRDLLLPTYNAGRRVAIGRAIYRVFYYNEIDLDRPKPHEVSWDKFGISFVYDVAQDDGVPNAPAGAEHDYHIFKLSRKDVVGDRPVRYSFFQGRKVGLRIDKDLKNLEIYEAD